MAKSNDKAAAKVADTAKREARKAAIDRLIENHGEEFADLMTEEHAQRGVEWNRRLTPEERAERDAARERERQARAAAREAEREQKALEALLAKHPGLAKRIATDS